MELETRFDTLVTEPCFVNLNILVIRLVTNRPPSLCITSYIDVQKDIKNQP
jgi:hypothetical protein